MRVRHRHAVGLDLGQLQDFTALAVLRWADGGRPTYEVPTLKRWALGTPYAAIGRDVARFLVRQDLQDADLVLDSTGVGEAVAELVTQELAHVRLSRRPVQVVITAGNAVTQAGRNRWNVAKRQLVSTMSAVVHSGRLKVAEGQPEAASLVKEMSTFKVKVNAASGGESFEAWRERDHDDLVLAVALATWFAERPKPVVRSYT